MEGVPKRTKWACSATRLDFDGLKDRLRKARDKFSGEPRELMQAYLQILRTYLELQEMSKPPKHQDLADLEDLLEPLEMLRIGLADLDQGLARLDLFEPDGTVKHTIPIEDAVNKAMAAAAIKLAPRGNKEKYAEEAARRLRVKRNHIKEFQQNLSRGRIKSQMANDIYDWCLFLAKQNTTETETALWLLSELKPVATKRRDLE
jgi:hypothetical protein